MQRGFSVVPQVDWLRNRRGFAGTVERGRLQAVLTRNGWLGYCPSSRFAQGQTKHSYLASVDHNPDDVMSTFCLSGNSQWVPCDLECVTEFSQRQTTICVELSLFAS